MTLLQFLKNFSIYGIGGIFIFGIELLVTMTLTEYFHIKPMISFAYALLLGIPLAFLFHSNVTFMSKKKQMKLRFIGTYVLSGTLFWLFAFITHKLIDQHYAFAIIASSIPISFITFSINKHWVFQHGTHKRNIEAS